MKTSVFAWTKYDRRPDLLAQHLDASVHYLAYGQREKLLHAPARYTVLARRMWRILLQERPDVVVVQNPPIFCPLVAFWYARRFGARYIIDSHTAAFLSPKWRWSLKTLHPFLSKHAATTIVSNSHLQKFVDNWGCNSVVLAFTPGNYPKGEHAPLAGEFNAAVISSFHEDEPLDVVFEAARRVPEVAFYVTGDSRRMPAELWAVKPDNCHLTGFISYERYIGLLEDVDVVVDLTTRDHTLLMGAYEAVSLGTPMILSNWPVLREYFTKGAIHIPNTVEGVYNGIRQAQQDRNKLRQEVALLRQELNEEWNTTFSQFQQLVYSQ